MPDGLVPDWWRSGYTVEQRLNYYPDPDPVRSKKPENEAGPDRCE